MKTKDKSNCVISIGSKYRSPNKYRVAIGEQVKNVQTKIAALTVMQHEKSTNTWKQLKKNNNAT